MRSVPFTTGDIHGGLSEGKGQICIEDDEVVLEVAVTVFGLFERDATTHHFDLTDLEAVRHKRTLFGDSITLRTRPMDRVAAVPGASQGTLVLKFKRRHRRDVDDLLDRLDLWLT